MRLIKGLITAIGIIGILVIIALVIGYYLYSLTPSIHARMTPVSVSADSLQSFDQKIDSFKTAIKTAMDAGEKKEISLTVTEKEVNSKLVQLLAEGELPLEQALINFGDGYFIVYTVADTPGINAKTGAIGQIKVADGEPKIIINDFDLGKLPLPKTVNTRVEQLANIMARLQLADISLEITNVQIKSHQLTITGTTKTAK